MQHEVVLFGARKGVNHVHITAVAKRGGNERLCFTAGK